MTCANLAPAMTATLLENESSVASDSRLWLGH